MSPDRAIRIAQACGAALLVSWSVAATTAIRQPARSIATSDVARADVAASSPPDDTVAIARIVEAALAFVREISRSLERGDYAGAIIRLLIIVEVLIAALGAVASITVRGKVPGDLVYRIVDVMGALFILIALVLIALTVLRPW